MLNPRRRPFDHSQVPVSLGDLHAHVDEGIADLILACWQLGIWTTASCQGDENDELGRAYIAFDPGSAELFGEGVTVEDLDEAPPDSLGWRLRTFDTDADDATAWTWAPSASAPVGFIAYFPSADIPELTRRLAARGVA